jgi:Protein of unknown function (DUF2815)
MPEAKEKDPRVVILRNVRLSYPNVFTAKKAQDSDKMSFSAAFLMDKVINAADIAAVKAACLFVKQEDGKGKSPGGPDRVCIRDGSFKEDKEGYGPGIEFVTARSDTRPGVVGRDGRTPLAAEDGILFAGCFVNASIRIWWQDHPKHGKRINAALMNIQFVRKGEPFGESKVAPEEQFENLGDENGEGTPSAPAASSKKGESWI